MMNMTKDELNRCCQILMDVWNAIAPDVDGECELDNSSAIEISTDPCYVDMYSSNGKKDSAFLQSLYEKYGYKKVQKALDKAYCIA